MKTLCMLFFFALFFSGLSAQTYKTEFTYDNAGNRISRKVIVLTSPQTRAPAGIETPDPLVDEWQDCKVKIYPNPTRGRLVVEVLCTKKEESLHWVGVYNSAGQRISTESFSGSGSAQADLSSCSEGIYILVVGCGKEENQYKIIKQ